MKVLHFYKTALPSTIGGIEVFIDGLCRTTSQMGVKNTVLSLAKNPALKISNQDGYQLIQAKETFHLASTGFSFEAISTFRKLASEADIIHYHFPNPFADVLHFICNPKKPTLVTYHSDIIRQKKILIAYKPLMQTFLRSVQHIVATSPNYLATSPTLNTLKEKVSIIPIGLNKDSYKPIDSGIVNYWLQKLPKKFFLFIGALRYYKGLHIALEAISGTDCQLVICGKGEEETALKNRALSLGLNNVHFLGSVSDKDKIALLSLCYAFVFPSHLRSEAFGISLLEAAMFEKPLISCEIGTGTSFINVDKETGLIVKPSSPESLREAMLDLLCNPDIAAEYGKNAGNRYQNLFTEMEQAKSYYSLYERLIRNL
jgi:rhamnosyl/mannosyltransferase